MMVQDPVCGLEVEAEQAPAIEYEGQRYWFCSEDCRIEFARDPQHYTQQRQH